MKTEAIWCEEDNGILYQVNEFGFNTRNARIVLLSDWHLIEVFIRDCANLVEHNAYSDGAAAILLPVAVGNIAERARRLMSEGTSEAWVNALLERVEELKVDRDKCRDLAERAEDLLRDAEGIDNAMADQWFTDMHFAKEGVITNKEGGTKHGKEEDTAKGD